MNAKGRYQEFDPLNQEEFAALEQDILIRGVQVPIVFDEYGNIIDGHHRLAICKKHGITDYPKIVKTGLSEDEKRDYAQSLNMARRSLTRQQRQDQIRNRLKRNPDHSDRSIAQGLGVDHKTVGRLRRDMETTGEVPQVDAKIGLNGMRYKASPKVVVDAEGGEVPQHLHSVFQCRSEFIPLCNLIGDIKRGASQLADRTGLGSKVSALHRLLDKAEDIIRTTIPHAIHSSCEGVGCPDCDHLGYTTGEVPQQG